jgi:hypothetical protein
LFTADGTENRMRWDRRARRWSEAWYTTLNHRDTGSGVWLRYTMTAATGTEPYCELWGFFFDPEGKRTFAGKHRFPIDQLGTPNGRDDGALVRIGDAWLSERHMEGRVSSDGKVFEWSLDFEPAPKVFQHLPQRLRRRADKSANAVCCPNLAVPFTGTVSLDGELLAFDGDRGQQSHRWGRGNAETWAWAHCSSFDGGEDAVFEGLAARSSIGSIPAPTLTFLYLRHEEMELSFNRLKWALRARSRYEMPTWAFTAHNDEWRIAGAGRSSIDRLIQVRYEDPDGTARHCANSEIADLAIEIYRKSRGEWLHAGSLTATRTANLEFGRRSVYPELPVSL